MKRDAVQEERHRVKDESSNPSQSAVPMDVDMPNDEEPTEGKENIADAKRDSLPFEHSMRTNSNEPHSTSVHSLRLDSEDDDDDDELLLLYPELTIDAILKADEFLKGRSNFDKYNEVNQ